MQNEHMGTGLPYCALQAKGVIWILFTHSLPKKTMELTIRQWTTFSTAVALVLDNSNALRLALTVH